MAKTNSNFSIYANPARVSDSFKKKKKVFKLRQKKKEESFYLTKNEKKQFFQRMKKKKNLSYPPYSSGVIMKHFSSD